MIVYKNNLLYIIIKNCLVLNCLVITVAFEYAEHKWKTFGSIDKKTTLLSFILIKLIT